MEDDDEHRLAELLSIRDDIDRLIARLDASRLWMASAHIDHARHIIGDAIDSCNEGARKNS